MLIQTIVRQTTITKTITARLTSVIKLTSLLLSTVMMLACSDAAQQVSEFSEPASSTISQTSLASPDNITASTNNGVITLNWSENSANNTFNNIDYNIYWNTTGNVNTNDTLVENVSSPHIIEDLTVGETYYFIVTAQITDQQSNPSYEIFATAPLPVLISITIEPANHAIISGNDVQYAANGNYSDGSILDLTTAVNWQSNDTDTIVINDISNKGLATTIITGVTNIIAVDPISNISGSTILTSQIDHGAFNLELTCNNSSCHQLPGSHMNTSSVCDACHTLGTESLIWSPVPVSAVDHNQISGECFDCHNNNIAEYKPTNHFTTSENCAKCHIIHKWSHVSVVDHNETFGSCIDCHNGGFASGKTATHIPSTDNCHTCHEPSPATWSPISNNAVDHNETIGTCFSCHNDVRASGKITTHVASTDICDDCHNTIVWLIL